MHELTAQELIQELRIHGSVMSLHTRALACHCECLGMNAENCQRAMLGQAIAYPDKEYIACMRKWGLVTKEGKSTL